jgi:hypothetical protein
VAGVQAGLGAHRLANGLLCLVVCAGWRGEPGDYLGEGAQPDRIEYAGLRVAMEAVTSYGNEGMKMQDHKDFIGKMKDNWRQRGTETTTFRAELRVIPRRLIGVLLGLYVVALAVMFWFTVSVPRETPFGISVESLPLKLLAVFGALTGFAIVVSAFVMLLGYIGSDAKRRGMRPVLWVLVAILVPYLIGVLLYFVVREPLPLNCPQCGFPANSQFNFCPACQFNLRPNCPQCRMTIHSADRFCPHCGFPLHSGSPAQAGAQEVRG